MKFFGAQALFVLWLAGSAAWCTAQEATARAVAAPAIEGETRASPMLPNALVQLREQLSVLTQPSENATQALQIGFLKLRRVCDYGLHEKPAQSGTEGDTRLVGDRPSDDLPAVQRALEKIKNQYRQSSRIGKNASCKYAPALQFFSAACQGYYEDSDRLTLTDQAAQRLIAQTQERLRLYGQYEVLERQGCTRSGFTQKLWANEEKNLWPLLMGAPALFKSLLPIASEN